MNSDDATVPQQHIGKEINVEHSVDTSSTDAAQRLFEESTRRLLNVNEWHEITKPALSVFQLTNERGEILSRKVQEGDYLRINVPGPGSKAGEGYDWVIVEKILYETTGTPTESISMRVRPTSNPVNPDASTAHFFSDAATSTFKVVRDHLSISSGVYGRNEVANTETSTVGDKMRNLAVAAGAKAGGSHLQWERLVWAILGNPGEK